MCKLDPYEVMVENDQEVVTKHLRGQLRPIPKYLFYFMLMSSWMPLSECLHWRHTPFELIDLAAACISLDVDGEM